MAMIHRVRWKFQDNKHHRSFVAERLKALKDGLKADVHANTSEHSLRLATWNIMHFGNSGGYDRTEESMLYIAEIIDHFDICLTRSAQIPRRPELWSCCGSTMASSGAGFILTMTSTSRPGIQPRTSPERWSSRSSWWSWTLT